MLTSTAGTPKADKDDSSSSVDVVMVKSTIVKMINQERNIRTPTRNNSVSERWMVTPKIENAMFGMLRFRKGRGINTNNRGTSINRVRLNICLKGIWDDMDNVIRMEKSRI